MIEILYFKTGVMGSAKTLNLISAAYDYNSKGFVAHIYKPKVDTRYSEDCEIRSRAGNSIKAIPFDSNFEFSTQYFILPDVIIVDESQFLTVKQVEELYVLSEFIPILCYGLKSDFKTELFPASKRLLELADSIEEFKSVCSCGRKAKFNARLNVHGDVITTGEQIGIEGDYVYESLCRFCYEDRRL